MKTDPAIPVGHLYAIRHSRRRLPAHLRPAKGRHVVAFRHDDQKIEIIDLLHDSMDLPARLR